MTGKLWVGVAMGLLALGAGCRMCLHHYDYCGPLFDGQCGGACDPRARAGSILAGSAAPVVDGVDESYGPALPDQATGLAPYFGPDFGVPPEQGSSVTERKLEDPPVEAAPAPEESTHTTPSPATGETQGWTAQKGSRILR